MNKQMIISSIVFLLVIAGMFGYVAYQKSAVITDPMSEPEQQVENEPYADITRIDAKQFYIDGVHTFAGEIPMPTPCDLLTTEAIVAESFPEQITLDFSVINNAEFCSQVITPQRFKIEVPASEEASVKALFQNRAVELNIIPAAPGETPDEFELFIKG